MYKGNLNFNGKRTEVDLLSLSPLLKIKINSLERDFAKKIKDNVENLFSKGEYVEILDVNEILALSNLNELQNIKEASDLTNNSNTSELLGFIKPIWGKCESYIKEMFVDEFNIAKIKIGVDVSKLTSEQKVLFESPSDSDFWLSQSCEDLEAISKFFRGYKS